MADILGPHLTARDVERSQKASENEMLMRIHLWSEELKKQLIDDLFKMVTFVEETPVLKVGVKEAMAMAAIATVLKNPDTTRRHLFNIFRM